MKILLTVNTFSGAHGSFQTFFDEIECALKNLGHEVFRGNNIRSALTVCERHAPDFSLGIGKYNFIADGKPLCEIYKKPHYQWIVDNPLKMPRFSAENFTPIFIDREFPELYEPPPKKFLCLPLGIKIEKSNFTCAGRLSGIVFAGQVKNLAKLRNEIASSRQSELAEKFLNVVTNDMNSSFILQYKNFLEDNSLDDEEEFFRLTNSYLRALKRVFVLESIKQYPLILAGEIAEESILQKPNVIYVGEVPYSELPELFSRYTHVLHISPNFSACIHDRILRGLKAGCQVIAEENFVLRQTLGDVLSYFDYKNFEEKKLVEVRNGNYETINKILAYFDWKEILTTVIENYQGEVQHS